jgi:hypothetical protein
MSLRSRPRAGRQRRRARLSRPSPHRDAAREPWGPERSSALDRSLKRLAGWLTAGWARGWTQVHVSGRFVAVATRGPRFAQSRLRTALDSQRPRCCRALTKCRRRDSNPRHADSDSRLIWLSHREFRAGWTRRWTQRHRQAYSIPRLRTRCAQDRRTTTRELATQGDPCQVASVTPTRGVRLCLQTLLVARRGLGFGWWS